MSTGPLTASELIELWKSVTDEDYNAPLLADPEAMALIEQAAEQLAAVSGQVDRNTQGLYILPHSGQTADPASGAHKAQVWLTFERDGLFEVPLHLPAGTVIEQRLNDFSPEGPIEVSTGRRFITRAPVQFAIGGGGPYKVLAEAEFAGSGYNHVRSDTLTRIVQVGTGYEGSSAWTEISNGSQHRIVAAAYPDTPVNDHVGKYLQIVNGANAGLVVRIAGVLPGNPSVPHGGVFLIANEVIIEVSGMVTPPVEGDYISQGTTAYGHVLSVSDNFVNVKVAWGSFKSGENVLTPAGTYGTVFVSNTMAHDNNFSWRVLDWHSSLYVRVTNEESAEGGKDGFLDAVGAERMVMRGQGEHDDIYRRRVATPADTISPGALRRAGNRALAPYGEAVCLREVGQAEFPGLFFDTSPMSEPHAYDLDFTFLKVSNTNVGVGYIEGEPVRAFHDGIQTSGIVQFENYRFHQFVMWQRVPTPDRNMSGVVNIRGPGFKVGDILEGMWSGTKREIVGVGDGGILPQHRFYLPLDIYEQRGFFMIGVPPMVLEDSGFFWDDEGFYDASTLSNFYDGESIGVAEAYEQVEANIHRARSAGVPFVLYIERHGCV